MKQMEWGTALTGSECKALSLPSDTQVRQFVDDPHYREQIRTADYFCFGSTERDYYLPAGHVGYLVVKYNNDHPFEEPFKVWEGKYAISSFPPQTLVTVLLRSGEVSKDRVHSYEWTHTGNPDDIVGYRVEKPELVDLAPAASDPEIVTLRRMTEDGWADYFSERNAIGDSSLHSSLYPGFICAIRELGLIREETLFEKFEREMGPMDENAALGAKAAIEWVEERQQ